ncbi:hypothetical protein BSKO_00656 [Bryopsis sp. KO-2023]|nr:hypothetical protein BSKO_00656 [Bryopsis sp. KO-2023]
MSVVAPVGADINAVNYALTRDAPEIGNKGVQVGNGEQKKGEVGLMVEILLKEFGALNPSRDELDPTSALESAAFVLSMACQEDSETFDAMITVTPCKESLGEKNCTNDPSERNAARTECKSGAEDAWPCAYYSPSLNHPGGYFTTAALSCFTWPRKNLPITKKSREQHVEMKAQDTEYECGAKKTLECDQEDEETLESLGVTEIPIFPGTTEHAKTL